MFDVSFEAAQTGPLLDFERTDVQRRWAEPARLSMSCLSVENCVGLWTKRFREQGEHGG